MSNLINKPLAKINFMEMRLIPPQEMGRKVWQCIKGGYGQSKKLAWNLRNKSKWDAQNLDVIQRKIKSMGGKKKLGGKPKGD